MHGAALLGLAWLALGGASYAGLAGVGDPPGNRVDYRIEARVDSESMTLAGRETVRFTNRTPVATSELWFHLYWNAFASNRSTHLVESGGQLRGVAVDSGWGWQRLTALRCGGADLAPALSYAAPDDANPDDRTVVRVALPQPVGPGETLEVELEWQAQIPRLRRRTGYKGDFLFIAQWFPKLGVFEGERGWNCHQFHASTEFYSDYGVYDVTLDLPAAYEKRIGATGLQAEPATRVGDRVHTRFVAPTPADQERADATGRTPWVHDFAWTADPDFKTFKRTFHFDAWRERFDVEVAAVQKVFGPAKNLRLRNVEVTVLIQPEHERQWERHYEATCAALFFYGLWFGEYPYSHITVVDPAWGAGAAGGMEYPTLFTAGTRLWSTPHMHSPEGVVVHEAGHQFWYGLVGNNEFEAAWLDEGFNSYTDSEAMARAFGRSRSTTEYAQLPFEGVAPAPGLADSGLAGALAARSIPLPWVDWRLTPLRSSGLVDWWRDQPLLTFVRQSSDPRWNDRVRYLSDPNRDPLDTPGWRHVDQRSYSNNSYQRTAVALRTLAGLVGRERFLLGMRHYAETWRYRHPYPQDFFDAFCAGAGVDVHWYFEELFRGTGSVDWSVSVEQRRGADGQGLAQAGPLDEFAALPAAQRAAGEQAPWSARVVLLRRGELRLPLDYELRYEDGARERRTWTREEQAQSRWLRLERTDARKLAAVVLDPDRLYFIDSDLSNNAWHAAEDRVAPARWSERAFQRWLQLLHWQAGLGG